MAIDTDLKFYKSANQSNHAESGGNISNVLIEDAKLNNLFDTVTPMQRQAGFLELKKVFSKVNKDNDLILYSEGLNLRSTSKDLACNIALLDSHNDKDVRSDIASYIGDLWTLGTQQAELTVAANAGQTLLTVKLTLGLQINQKYILKSNYAYEAIVPVSIKFTSSDTAVITLKSALKNAYIIGDDIYNLIPDTNKNVYGVAFLAKDANANDTSIDVKANALKIYPKQRNVYQEIRDQYPSEIFETNQYRYFLKVEDVPISAGIVDYSVILNFPLANILKETFEIKYLYNGEWRVVKADKTGKLSGDGTGSLTVNDANTLLVTVRLSYTPDTYMMFFFHTIEYYYKKAGTTSIGFTQSGKLTYNFSEFFNFVPKSLKITAGTKTYTDKNGDGKLLRVSDSVQCGIVTYAYDKAGGKFASINLDDSTLTTSTEVKLTEVNGTHANPSVSGALIKDRSDLGWGYRFILPYKNIVPGTLNVSFVQSNSFTNTMPVDDPSKFMANSGKDDGVGKITLTTVISYLQSAVDYTNGYVWINDSNVMDGNQRIWYKPESFAFSYYYKDTPLTPTNTTGVNTDKIPLSGTYEFLKAGQEIAIYNDDFSQKHLTQIASVIGSTKLILTNAIAEFFSKGSVVTNIMPKGDIDIDVPINFTQEAWTSAWSDTRIGNPASGTYDFATYPFVLTNAGTFTDRYFLRVTALAGDNLTLELISEKYGVIAQNLSSLNDITVNGRVFTTKPLFLLKKEGWGVQPAKTWKVGNIIRFNTAGSYRPFWAAKVVDASDPKDGDDSAIFSISGKLSANFTYTTLNPNDKQADVVLSTDLLNAKCPLGGAMKGVRGTLAKSTGKYYVEFSSLITEGLAFAGFAQAGTPLETGIGDLAFSRLAFVKSQLDQWLYYNEKALTSDLTSWTNKVLRMAIDLDKKIILVGVNDKWSATSYDISEICGAPLFPYITFQMCPDNWSVRLCVSPVNIKYDCPSGFIKGWPQQA